MIKILKKQGIKAALPLLLLATACGEGTPSSALSDNIEGAPSSGGSSAAVVASTTMPDAGALAPSGLLDAAIVPGDDADDTDVMPQAKANSFADTATKVPEPATLTGLAIAALGLGAIKRKRIA